MRSAKPALLAALARPLMGLVLACGSLRRAPCCQRVTSPPHLPCLQCSGHEFYNRGIGGTSSGVYAVCAEHMVHEVGAPSFGGWARRAAW